MSYDPPEFGEDAYLEYLGGIESWPNVNAYEGLAVAFLTLERLDSAANIIANADEIVGGEAGRQEALERMNAVRSRLTKVWIPTLQAKIAQLGTGENCASLTAPGAGVFTWLVQKVPGSVVGQPYLMEGDTTKYGLSQEEITTYFTPEFASPDYFVQNYLVGDNRDQVQGIIDAVFMTQADPFAYECVDPVTKMKINFEALPKPEPETSKKGFPWPLIILAAIAAASKKKR